MLPFKLERVPHMVSTELWYLVLDKVALIGPFKDEPAALRYQATAPDPKHRAATAMTGAELCASIQE